MAGEPSQTGYCPEKRHGTEGALRDAACNSGASPHQTPDHPRGRPDLSLPASSTVSNYRLPLLSLPVCSTS